MDRRTLEGFGSNLQPARRIQIGWHERQGTAIECQEVMSRAGRFVVSVSRREILIPFDNWEAGTLERFR